MYIHEENSFSPLLAPPRFFGISMDDGKANIVCDSHYQEGGRDLFAINFHNHISDFPVSLETPVDITHTATCPNPSYIEDKTYSVSSR